MWFTRVLYNLIPESIKDTVKLYAFNGLCVITVCVLMYRNLTTSELITPDVVFDIGSLYVQTLITLITIRNTLMCCKRTSGTNHKNIFELMQILDENTISGVPHTNVIEEREIKNDKLLHWIYWTLAFMFLIISNLLRLLNYSHVFPENIIQIFLCTISMIFDIRFCLMCTKFRNGYHNLNKLVTIGGLTTKKLLAIRWKRNKFNDHVRKMTGSYSAQILSVIATTAVAAVFKIHRTLRSTERFENTVSSAADLLDVSHRVLRLFALCKVSEDVTNEAREIVINLLNVNPSTDKNLENEISFFLWETVNPPLEVRLIDGTFVLGPKLFISVFSWCVGFILILLQFRLPRTY